MADETTYDGPAELRDALERKEERIQKLEAKLKEEAFAKAGFGDPKSKERNALERFFDGDPTDAEAIATFATEVMGYSPPVVKEDKPPAESVASGTPETQRTVPSVQADMRSAELDAAAINQETGLTEDQEAAAVAHWMDRAIKKGYGNTAEIVSAMSAELARFGYVPNVPVPPT